jgi:tRNA threonylcarbamoyladenosine biosynthesis protein TsaB
MRLLAIETSGKTGEFAVLDEGGVLSESTVDVAGRLVEKGIGEVEDVLGRAGTALADLDAVAVSMGPGSFTGLRVGLAMAKGLCFRRKIALVGVPTLDALAEARAGRQGFIVPVMDARRGEIYLAIYRSDGKAVSRLTDYLALKPDAAIEMIRRECGASHVLLMGDAIAPYGEVLAAGLGSDAARSSDSGPAPGAEFAPEEAWRVRAGVVGRIGLSLLSEGKVLDPVTAEPMYIRPSEAERKAGRG